MSADGVGKKPKPYPDWSSGVTFVLWGLLAFGAPSILALSGPSADGCTWEGLRHGSAGAPYGCDGKSKDALAQREAARTRMEDRSTSEALSQLVT